MFFGGIFIYVFLFISVCYSQKGNKTEDEFSCNYEGKSYKLGEQIETPDEICLYCECHPRFTAPNEVSCYVIGCPWDSYFYRPNCIVSYIITECCPQFYCSAPPPHLDNGFRLRKRHDKSTDGYVITADAGSELTLYCISKEPCEEMFAEDGVWTVQKNGEEFDVENGTRVNVAFFHRATWALYFDFLNESDAGIYFCRISSDPPQLQMTQVIVRGTELKIPLVSDVCLQPAFLNDSLKNECPQIPVGPLPWYYDLTKRICVQHVNTCSWATEENHFPDWSDCFDHCSDDCLFNFDSGNGTDAINRYYYNYSSDFCSDFTYSGSGGNRNNFHSKIECENRCAKVIYRKDDR